MHIYLDESGTFTGLARPEPSLSAVGALAIPSRKLARVFERYAKLRPMLPAPKGEVKGSKLSEAQVAAVIEILAKNEALFFCSVIDMAMHTHEEIDRHRVDGIAALSRNLTDGHSPDLRADVASLQSRMSRFNDQLYSQMMVTLDLLHGMLDTVLNYHAQRTAVELSSFHWIVDAKNATGITDWEDWWSKTLVVWLQAMSLKRPGQLAPFGDFTHFERYLFRELPEYLIPHAPADLDFQRGAGIDLQRLFREEFRFSSAAEPGLELVDIVTNATRRALTGSLGRDAWIQIGRLLIHRADFNVRPVSLRYSDEAVSRSYSSVLRAWKALGRTMITPSNRR